VTTRFPGFDVVSQHGHWDPVTAGVVLARLAPPEAVRFFGPHEQATCVALVRQLLDLEDDNPVPVAAMIDSRLAEQQTDGWRYADLPSDGAAWRRSLAHLDADAWLRCGRSFAEADADDQAQVVDGVQTHDDAVDWHGLPASRVWSLWTRYACTAFYSHPFAFDEMGFPGPAYPRGYKNRGIDRREPFEVADFEPEDPVPGHPGRRDLPAGELP
jgi:Gluconate 2-dehydrogenase subunit 3